jgi:hypothetical protein
VHTAGSSKIEKALCNAGAISGLLDLIRRCQEAPEEAPEPAPVRSKLRAPAPPSKQSLLEPAVVALSNLAAESAAVKDDMRQAGAIDLCVQLLTAQVEISSLALFCKRSQNIGLPPAS